MCFAGTVIRDEMGLTLEKAHKELLGTATKVLITKDSTLIVTDGSTQLAVMKRVAQIQRLVEVNQIICCLFIIAESCSCSHLSNMHL